MHRVHRTDGKFDAPRRVRASNFPRWIRSPRLAFLFAAFVGCVWLNQGPPLRRYDALVGEASLHPLVRSWLPLAFAYRRSADEELYFATANAIRGTDYDEAVLLAKRGEMPEEFKHFPHPDGQWHRPYSEVPFEYPALILPFVVLPSLLSSTFDMYAVYFGLLMAGLVILSVSLAVRANPRPTPVERAEQWWFAAALFLAQGALLVQRVDAVATVLLAAALWAAVYRRPFLFGLGIGLAGAAKIIPVLLLLPMMAADRETFRSRGAVARVAAGFAAGLAASVVPMVLLSPSAVGALVGYHAARGLHVESTYGVFFAVAGLLLGESPGVTLSFGSYNLGGEASSFVSKAATPLLLFVTLGFSAWVMMRSRPRSEAERRDAIVCAALGALLCIWLFSKVFSPQYMTWAIPFAAAIANRGVRACLLLAMAISQAYLRGFYDSVVAMRPLGVVALGARLCVLAILAVVLIRALSVVDRMTQVPSRRPAS